MELWVIVDTLVIINRTVLSQIVELGRQQPWQDSLGNYAIAPIEDENSVEEVQVCRPIENERCQLEEICVGGRTCRDELFAFVEGVVVGSVLCDREEDSVVDVDVLFLLIGMVHCLDFTLGYLLSALDRSFLELLIGHS